MGFHFGRRELLCRISCGGRVGGGGGTYASVSQHWTSVTELALKGIAWRSERTSKCSSGLLAHLCIGSCVCVCMCELYLAGRSKARAWLI